MRSTCKLGSFYRWSEYVIKQRRLKVCAEKPQSVRSAIVLNEIQSSLDHIIVCTKLLTEQAQSHGYIGLVPDLKKIHAATITVCNLINRDVPFADEMKTGEKPEVDALARFSRKSVEPKKPQIHNSVQGSEKASILVVDNDTSNRDMLFRSLGGHICRVEMAATAEQALLTLRADEFDLVLLDVQLLGQDVYSVLQQLKSDEALRHIPVIVSSAVNELDSVVRCIEMGAEDYLSRPFEPTLLQARIGSCLDKKRSHDGELRLIKQLQSHYKCLQELDVLVAALQN